MESHTPIKKVKMFEREKNSGIYSDRGWRRIILKAISSYLLSFTLLMIAVGLFARGESKVNKERDTYLCLLFYTEDNPTPSSSYCRYAIAGEVLAGVGLVILYLIGLFKFFLD